MSNPTAALNEIPNRTIEQFKTVVVSENVPIVICLSDDGKLFAGEVSKLATTRDSKYWTELPPLPQD
jgi:hypothetical protein